MSVNIDNSIADIANYSYNSSAREFEILITEVFDYLESNNLVICNNCNYVFNFDYEGIYDHHNYYCDDCKPSNHIQRYHNYQITNNTQTIDTFGIELEVEFPNSESTKKCAEEVYKKLGNTFIMAEDGSLCHGIEFISHVWDMRDIKIFYTKIEKLTKIIKKYGGICHESPNSGLHVHIGLKYYCELSRLKKFMYEHAHFCACLSGRLPKPGTFEYARPYENGRYSFINETDLTVEFRLWNSTLEPTTIIQRIALSYYLYNFTSEFENLKEIDFYRYIKNDNTFSRYGMPINLLAYCHKWMNKRFEDIIPYI